MLNCAFLRVVFAFLISDGIPVPIRAYPVLLQLGAAFVTQRLGLIVRASRDRNVQAGAGHEGRDKSTAELTRAGTQCPRFPSLLLNVCPQNRNGDGYV